MEVTPGTVPTSEAMTIEGDRMPLLPSAGQIPKKVAMHPAAQMILINDPIEIRIRLSRVDLPLQIRGPFLQDST